MKHVPFGDKPTKLAYLWRDIKRRAAMYGIARTESGQSSKQWLVENYNDGDEIFIFGFRGPAPHRTSEACQPVPLERI
jgi:uncharacterized protein (DUF2235 family)